MDSPERLAILGSPERLAILGTRHRIKANNMKNTTLKTN
jgi:hypothetical protein